MKQIGIALQTYHNTHGTFPAGCVGAVGDPVNIQGWGWATFLLPFVEQQPLYDTLDPNRNSLPAVLASATLQPYLQTPIPVFRCASDTGDDLQSGDRTLSGFVLSPTSPAQFARSIPQWRPHGISAGPLLFACLLPGPGAANHNTGTSSNIYGVRAATSNYVASLGDFWLPAGSTFTDADFAGNGVFGSNVSVRAQDILDGTSQTFAIGERSWLSYASIWAGTDGWDRCEREGVPMIMATAFYLMNASPDPYYLSCDPRGAAGYSSLHPKGAHFLLTDGAVRFISDNINFANSSDPSRLGVFQRLARRDDGQAVGGF